MLGEAVIAGGPPGAARPGSRRPRRRSCGTSDRPKVASTLFTTQIAPGLPSAGRDARRRTHRRCPPPRPRRRRAGRRRRPTPRRRRSPLSREPRSVLGFASTLGVSVSTTCAPSDDQIAGIPGVGSSAACRRRSRPSARREHSRAWTCRRLRSPDHRDDAAPEGGHRRNSSGPNALGSRSSICPREPFAARGRRDDQRLGRRSSDGRVPRLAGRDRRGLSTGPTTGIAVGPRAPGTIGTCPSTSCSAAACSSTEPGRRPARRTSRSPATGSSPSATSERSWTTTSRPSSMPPGTSSPPGSSTRTDTRTAPCSSTGR